MSADGMIATADGWACGAIDQNRIGRPARDRLALAGILVLAIVLRLEPVLFVPSIDWADEIFQATEQAHRLVYGIGIVPWEFQLGVRSWLLPGLLAGLMEAARLFGDGPGFYLPVIFLALAALAAVPVACSFGMARRRFGLSGAIVASLTVAVAPEVVFFGARPLCEVLAGHLLVAAAYLLDPGCRVASRRRLLGAGMLLGATLVLRVQLAPAIALIGLCNAGRAWRLHLPALITGGLLVLMSAGALDAATLGYPLASLWRYVLYNVFYGVSSTFGVETWDYYVAGENGVWGASLGAMLMLVLIGGRQSPVLLAAVVSILALHSGIGHKEYRFIYPAILLGAVLAGLGLAQIAAWLDLRLSGRGMPPRLAQPICAVGAAAIWCALSLHVWTGNTLLNVRGRAHDDVMAASFVASLPQLCGIGLYYGGGEDWVHGGYTYFHKPVPMYWPADARELTAMTPGFDVLVSAQTLAAGTTFARLQCFGEVCVWQRPGRCTSVAGKPMPFPAPLENLRGIDR